MKAINHPLTLWKNYYRLNTKGHTHHNQAYRIGNNIDHVFEYDSKKYFWSWARDSRISMVTGKRRFYFFQFSFILLFDRIDNSFGVIFFFLHLFCFVPSNTDFSMWKTAIIRNETFQTLKNRFASPKQRSD